MCLVPIANELARCSLQPVRRENGGRRGRIGLCLTILMLAVLLFPFQVAFGIVPSTQAVDNPVIDFNAVVQMDGFPGTSKPGGGVNGPNGRGVGTGSIVMKFLGQNGDYYVCVLTADHVVSEPALSGKPLPNDANAIGFGNSVAAGTGSFNEYKIVASAVGGATFAANGTTLAPAKEDLAMELVNLGNNPTANIAPGLTYNDIIPLTPVSLNNGLPAAGTNFTIVGFGDTGMANAAGNTYTSEPGSFGTKRFFNNTTNLSIANANDRKYINNLVRWSPGFGPGQGAVLPGDSGAPMLTTSVLPNGMNAPTMTYAGVNNVAASNSNVATLFGVAEGGPVPVRTALSLSWRGPINTAWLSLTRTSCGLLRLATRSRQ